MRLVLMGDTHGHHRDVIVPPGDVLVHTGDICMSVGLLHSQIKERHANTLTDFNEWLSGLPHAHKIVIAGNHDILLEACPPDIQRQALSNATYLQDSGVEIDGVKFWGSPWTPWYGDLAFVFSPNKGDAGAVQKERLAKWSLIPEDTDVLVTHGPPYGVLDRVPRGKSFEYAGCPELAKRVRAVAPKVHAFGHIHVGHGTLHRAPTRFCNVALVNHKHAVCREPRVVELEE